MKFTNKAKNPTHTIFGKATDGTNIEAPISTFPHALITGATGSGKSVFINSLLTIMMAVSHPDEVKLIIIDPKGNEFGNYKGLPYMLTDPIIDLSDSASALEYLATEMDYRLQLFQKYGGKKDIEAFNKAIEKGEIKGVEKLPYIILMIDELADLMSQFKSEVEGEIKRVGAKARAAGVHMLLATQTPRKEYVDGAIKANVPTRFALMASGTTESLVALGEVGAEKLKPKGDFYAKIGGGSLRRGQAPYVEDDELLRIFKHLRETYPEPDLININEALDEAQLRYKKLVAENKGDNPEDITLEGIKEEEKASSVFTPQAKQSSRSEEEREKARKRHNKTMEQIEKNKENGNEGSKTVSIDTSKFSFAKRNKKRKEKGLEEKNKSSSGVIPASNSKNKRSEASKKTTKAKTEPTKTSQEKPPVSKSTTKQTTSSQPSSTQDKKKEKVRRVKRTKTNQKPSAKNRVKKKKRKTSGGSPLARKR